jgi:AcrR family transcriptional regulator
MMNYIGERRAEERDLRRNNILDAAEAVAVEVGIDALTMHCVARRCRLSRALLYVYFAGKPDLVLGLCERGYSQLRKRFEQADTGAHSGIDQICAMGRSYFAFAREWPVYFELIARFEACDLKREAAQNSAACVAARMRLHQLMVVTLHRGQCDGSIVANLESVSEAAMALWGSTHGIVQLAQTKDGVLTKYGVSAKTLIEQGIALVRRGLAQTGE